MRAADDAKMEQTGDSVADTFRKNAEALVSARSAPAATRSKTCWRPACSLRGHVPEQAAPRSPRRSSRDSATLGSLITRHIAEFDHTVKTYGGELVERLGQRTQDVSEAMRNYLDSFDQRVTGRSDELNSTLDKRLTQFEEALGARMTSLAKTLTDGGKEVVDTLDKRIGAGRRHHHRARRRGGGRHRRQDRRDGPDAGRARTRGRQHARQPHHPLRGPLWSAPPRVDQDQRRREARMQ